MKSSFPYLKMLSHISTASFDEDLLHGFAEWDFGFAI